MPTHGSLTKAGKVRAQTPRVDSTSKSDSPGPLRKNRRNYVLRILTTQEDRYSGRR